MATSITAPQGELGLSDSRSCMSAIICFARSREQLGLFNSVINLLTSVPVCWLLVGALKDSDSSSPICPSSYRPASFKTALDMALFSAISITYQDIVFPSPPFPRLHDPKVSISESFIVAKALTQEKSGSHLITS